MQDSEQLFDECVRAAGGVRVTQIFGVAPSFENADYYFDGEAVVAELKSLQKDFLTSEETEQRMQLLVNKWVEERKIPPAYGEPVIRTAQLPKACAEELLDVFRIPLERVVRKAERQMVATKSALKRPDAIGLLCLANDGNFALDPETTVYLLNRCLENAFPAIENALLFSANLITNIKGGPEDAFLFAGIHFPGRRQIPEALWQKLQRAWHAVLERTFGKKIVNRHFRNVGPADGAESRFWRR
jgi:hypothetical protein